jgi:hypothetical protein
LLPFTSLALLLIRDFAQISDSLNEILLGVAIAIQLVFSAIYFWHQRRARQANRSSAASASFSDQM